ncbi:DUF4344 domain-containing metallopeptidase [Streptomyces sp. NPDC048337]|uniref:DUF4344 domain-containing metallopeptidase n=1 Tax=Streptomyces sp. NPDC048337 TaxID=3365535 RepID=UPI0037147D6D
MITRHRAMLGAVLLLLAAACGQQDPPGSGKGFTLRYEEPAAADRDHHRFLKDRAPAEAVLADLNGHLALPRGVEVVARSCDGGGTGYDPEEHRIELCYDDLAEERDLIGRSGSAHPDEDLSHIVRETLYHEAGHALLDALHRTLDDRAEEDAADRFAQVMLLRAGDPEGEQTLLAAARSYDAEAAADPAPDPADEHAPPATRAASHRCAVYGAGPARHPELAGPARADCSAVWTRTRDSWTRDLAPLLRH